MVGTSRKSFISKVLELSDEQNLPMSDSRLAGTLVTLIIAVINGANIVRVHDVRETVQAIKMYRAIESAECKEKT
jgi:dihydropteroate synthase